MTGWIRRLGLRGQILLLTLPAVNLAFVAIWYLATATARDGLFTLSNANLETAAASLTDRLAHGIVDVEADARAAALLDITAQTIETGDAKNFALFADVLVRSKRRYAAFVLSDRGGRVVAASTVGRNGAFIRPLLGRSILEEDWARRMASSRQAVEYVPVSRPRFLVDVLAPGESVAGVALPVTDLLGERIGTLTAFISSLYLSEVLERFVTVRAGVLDALAVITDQEGRLLMLPESLATNPDWTSHALSIAVMYDTEAQHWLGPNGARFLHTGSASRPELRDFGWRVFVLRSVATIEAPVRRISARLLTAFVIAIVITSIVLIVLATRVVRPIQRLTAAASRTGKASDFEPIVGESEDEVGVLTSAFNRMLGDLKEYQHGLEVKVNERTSELRGRNRDMRLVLDNVQQGLVTVSLSGHLAHEHSAVVTEWFGPYRGDVLFSDYLRSVDSIFAETFALAYEALREDVMPRALCLDQLPRRLRHGAREVAFSYVPIVDGEGDELKGLLVVMDDITEQLQAAVREAERKELLALVERLGGDRLGVQTFVAESDQLLERLARSSDGAEVKRILHTLKGNAQIQGLGVIGELCHTAESQIADGDHEGARTTRAKIEARWRDLRSSLSRFLGDRAHDVVELEVGDIEALARDLSRGLPLSGALERLAAWQLEPAERALQRLGSAARSLARRLGKGDLELEIDGKSVLLDAERWGGLWTEMVHVVRNAVDHGLERPEVRKTLGKPTRPHLRLAARLEGQRFALEVEDDGAGVDWGRVAAVAQRSGLPSATEADLVAALFRGGLSTKAAVSETSGRGVGLAALGQRVRELGGHVRIESTPGQGTRFVFTFDLAGTGSAFGIMNAAGPARGSRVEG